MSSSDFFPDLTIPDIWIPLGLPGIPPTPKRNALCVFHEERTPSLSVTRDGRGYNCFGCSARGGLLNFAMRVRQCDKKLAIQTLEALSNAPTRHHQPHQFDSRPERRSNDRPSALERLKVKAFADLSIGTEEEWARLSKLRNIGIEGIRLAAQRGHLRFGASRYRPFDRCWIVGDRRGHLAEARRLTGQLFRVRDKEFKCDSIGNGKKVPLGIEEAKNYPFLVLTEGSSDFLAIHDLIDQAADRDQIGALSMLGANNLLAPEALEMLQGCRIRFLTDNDEAGELATENWFKQLEPIAQVERFNLNNFSLQNGRTVKDVNEYLYISKTQNEREDYHSILEFDSYE